MTDTEKELRRLAEAAKVFGRVESRVKRIQTGWNSAHEDKFIEAATPQVVLTLLERVEALEKQARPSHPTAEHSQRVVTALESMLAPLSDGTLGTRDVAGRVSALLERNKTLESFATGFVQAVDDATAHAENTGKGMQVPFHGDFAQAKQVPSILGRLKWWANAAREALGQKP